MDAIVLAAGKSRRIGDGREKQLVRIGGKPLLVLALQGLAVDSRIERFIVACRTERIGLFQETVKAYRFDRPIMFVAGGDTRQESVRKALEFVTSSRVLVHEAARPIIPQDTLDRVLSADGPAVVPVVPIPFSVAVGRTHMEAPVERDQLRNIQLPQVFATDILRQAHSDAKYAEVEATEDSQLVHRIGGKVTFVDGDVENIKVTYPVDLAIVAELIYGQMVD